MNYIYKKIKFLLEEVSDLDMANSMETNPSELARLANHYDPNIVHAVAKNPATPAGTLENLHHRIRPEDSTQDHIHNALMGNPNTPLPVLKTYLKLNPKNVAKVLDNPALPLLTLDDPNLQPLLQAYSPDTDPQTLYNLSKHRDQDVVNGVASNENAHPSILRNVYYDNKANPTVPRLHDQIGKNKNTPVDVLRDILMRGYGSPFENPTVIQAQQKDPGLKELFHDQIHYYHTLANRATNPAVLKALVRHPNDEVVDSAIRNANISPEDLDYIAKNSKDTENSLRIASHKNTSADTISNLASRYGKDPLINDLVLPYLLRRTDLTAEHFKQLEPHIFANEFCGRLASSNNRTPANILHKLSDNDNNYDLLSKNPNVSASTLHKIAKNAININKKDYEKTDWADEVLSNITKHPNVQPETKELIRQDLR